MIGAIVVLSVALLFIIVAVILFIADKIGDGGEIAPLLLVAGVVMLLISVFGMDFRWYKTELHQPVQQIITVGEARFFFKLDGKDGLHEEITTQMKFIQNTNVVLRAVFGKDMTGSINTPKYTLMVGEVTNKVEAE